MRHQVEKSLRLLEFNGNEIVFSDDPLKGVARIDSRQPDKLALSLVGAYNLVELIDNSYWINPEDAIGEIRKWVHAAREGNSDAVLFEWRKGIGQPE